MSTIPPMGPSNVHFPSGDDHSANKPSINMTSEQFQATYEGMTDNAAYHGAKKETASPPSDNNAPPPNNPPSNNSTPPGSSDSTSSDMEKERQYMTKQIEGQMKSDRKEVKQESQQEIKQSEGG